MLEASTRLSRQRVFLFMWVLLIVLVSIAPLSVKEQLHTTGRLHYIGHFGVFAVTALLALWNVRSRRGQILCAVLVAMLGVAVELAEAVHYQGFLEKRDLAVDWLGVAVGCAVAGLLSRKSAVDGLQLSASADKS